MAEIPIKDSSPVGNTTVRELEMRGDLPHVDGEFRGADMPLRSLRAKVEIQAIQQVLEHTNWNRRQAARLLEISYRTLLYKIKRYKITRRNEMLREFYSTLP
jgi:DNA-binding NtrC family response regulator